MHRRLSTAAGSLLQPQAERSTASAGPSALRARPPAINSRQYTLTRRPVLPASHKAQGSQRGYALRTSHDRDEPRFARSSSGRKPLAREPAAVQAEGRADKADPGDAQAIVSQELVAPVQVPEDFKGVLSKENDPHIADVLAQSALVVTREIEMMK
jgi:hypothetical protein